MSNVTRKIAVFIILFAALAMTNMPLYAQFKLRLDETSNYGPAIVHHVNEEEGIDERRVQACNDEVCLRPSFIDVPIPVEIVDG